MVLLGELPSKFSWVGVRKTQSYKLTTGREVKNRCIRIAKIIKISGKHCKVDFYKINKSGAWQKDGSGSDDVLIDDVIVIQPPLTHPDPSNKSLCCYEFTKDIIKILRSYFEK